MPAALGVQEGSLMSSCLTTLYAGGTEPHTPAHFHFLIRCAIIVTYSVTKWRCIVWTSHLESNRGRGNHL